MTGFEPRISDVENATLPIEPQPLPVRTDIFT